MSDNYNPYAISNKNSEEIDQKPSELEYEPKKNSLWSALNLIISLIFFCVSYWAAPAIIASIISLLLSGRVNKKYIENNYMGAKLQEIKLIKLNKAIIIYILAIFLIKLIFMFIKKI